MLDFGRRPLGEGVHLTLVGLRLLLMLLSVVLGVVLSRGGVGLLLLLMGHRHCVDLLMMSRVHVGLMLIDGVVVLVLLLVFHSGLLLGLGVGLGMSGCGGVHVHRLLGLLLRRVVHFLVDDCQRLLLMLCLGLILGMSIVLRSRRSLGMMAVHGRRRLDLDLDPCLRPKLIWIESRRRRRRQRRRP